MLNPSTFVRILEQLLLSNLIHINSYIRSYNTSVLQNSTGKCPAIVSRVSLIRAKLIAGKEGEATRSPAFLEADANVGIVAGFFYLRSRISSICLGVWARLVNKGDIWGWMMWLVLWVKRGLGYKRKEFGARRCIEEPKHTFYDIMGGEFDH